MKKLILLLLGIALLLSVYFISRAQKHDSIPANSIPLSTVKNPDNNITDNNKSINENNQSPIIPKNKRDKNPDEAFSDSKTGQRIIKVLALIRYLDSPASEKGKEAWDNIQKLRDNPSETFNEVAHGVSALSFENETKRQFLIQFASSLDVGKDEKLSFLDKELRDSIYYAKSTDNIQVLVTPSIIFETYLRVSANNDVSEKLLIDILPDASPQVQKTLLSAYNKINPKKTDELIKQYNLKTN
ncbi:MAG: hypothetical protein NTY22_03465 [Proteobacteria bacterium]|nr:hypothetical protein [Pseudomonadota bacterium]